MNCNLIIMGASVGAAVLMTAAAAQTADVKSGKASNTPAITNKATRLQLELMKTEPVPVIGCLYTCFFSAYDKTGEFQSIGKATFRVKEIVEGSR